MYARDAMPSGGRLQLTIGPGSPAELADTPGPAGWVQLTMHHTGAALSPAEAARLFEPFTAEPGDATRLGLGLASVYGIVTQSHGHIAVSSQPGLGTTFRIHLPAAMGTTPIAVPCGGPVAATGTVLLVEDEPAVRRLARTILAAAGYEVLEAGTGAQALALSELHAGPIDVLLTDVVMPGMSGPQLAAQLSARRPGLRVLFMSGYLPDTISHHGLAASGDLIEKPLTPGSLRDKVREVLERAPGGAAEVP
jgi:CheY-like chemotaxis protein